MESRITYVSVEPYLDGLGGKAAVALANNEATTGPEHPPNLLENLKRLCKVVDAHHACNDVK